MKVVAFDESGNSGENLLDREQPIYALAGICLDEEDADALVSRLLKGRQASELKFSSLRKRSSGQRVVLDVLASAALDARARRLCVSEKSWFLAGKIIDLLVEPVTGNTAAFYESGIHRVMADWLYGVAAAEVGEELWQQFQVSFVHAARTQGPEEEVAIAELRDILREVQIAAAGTPTGKILGQVPDSVDYLAGELGGGGAKDQLEPAVTALVEQIQGWSERLSEPFRVIHDDSKVIEAWVGELLAWSNPSIEPVSVEIGAATFSLPLQANSIEFATSDSNSLIQLADVISGAAAWWLKDELAGGQDAFAEQIRTAGLRAEWSTGSLQFQRSALLGS